MNALRHMVGASPAGSVPPAQGGAATESHRALVALGVHPTIVANLTAPAAAGAVAGAVQALGQAQRAIQQGPMATQQGSFAGSMPREVPRVGNGPREFPMGFGLTAVAAGAQQIVNANPQVNFRPSRLVIPDTSAQSFMVNDFKIGMRSQLVAPGALPATSFTEKAVGTAMSLDTVNVGQFVTLDISNVSTQAANFTASLFGCTLDS